jgi:protein-S-isoprenylcysteine O-methyltransferase Ste14
MKCASDSRLIIRGIATPLILLAAIMLAAGRLTYWQGWVFGGSNFVLLVVNYLLLRERPDLIRERLAPGKGTKWWDKVYFAVTTPLFFITIILAALDKGRFHWSPALPVWIYILSYVVYAAGQAVHLLAKGTNHWFATVARIQKDRGQEVCREEPYRFVRHPGYVGGLLFILAIPLIFVSWLALIPQAIAAGFLVARTYLEDRLLLAGLPGYTEYAKQVRHRLLPL